MSRPADGLRLALAGTLLMALSTAWVQWLLIGRFWLPLTGRLPWRIHAFLADAYDRGVLRRNGSAFQYRHELLRDELVRE